MGELLSKVLPLSLGAAVSPTVLAVILVVLSGRRAVARGTAYLGGVLLVLVGLTMLGLYGIRQTTPSPTTVTVEHVIDGAAGALLLLLAIGTIVRTWLNDASTNADTADSDAELTDAAASERSAGIVGAFLLGVAMMLSNFSTILLYLPAMHAISTAHLPVDETALAVVIAFVITSLPATAPYAFRLLAPSTAGPAFDRLHSYVTRYQRRIAIAIELIFGVYLLVKGLR